MSVTVYCMRILLNECHAMRKEGSCLCFGSHRGIASACMGMYMADIGSGSVVAPMPDVWLLCRVSTSSLRALTLLPPV